MRIAGNVPLLRRPAEPDEPGLRATPTSHWWDGSEVYGADADKAQPAAGGREAAADRRRLPARGHQRAWRSPASTRAGGSGSAACTRCSPASTTSCATSSARTTGLERRAGLPDGAADRLRADRQDPHRRVDAGDPRHQGDRRRPQGQLERPAGQRLADQARHLADRHPRQSSASRRPCRTTTARRTR